MKIKGDIVKRSFKNIPGSNCKYSFPGSTWLVIISLSLKASSPKASQSKTNLKASSGSHPDKVSKDLHSLSELLLQYATILTVMFSPLLSSWNFPYCKVCLLPLILPMDASEEGLSLPSCLGLCLPRVLLWFWKSLGCSWPLNRIDDQSWFFSVSISSLSLSPRNLNPTKQKLPAAPNVPETKTCRLRVLKEWTAMCRILSLTLFLPLTFDQHWRQEAVLAGPTLQLQRL